MDRRRRQGANGTHFSLKAPAFRECCGDDDNYTKRNSILPPNLHRSIRFFFFPCLLVVIIQIRHSFILDWASNLPAFRFSSTISDWGASSAALALWLRLNHVELSSWSRWSWISVSSVGHCGRQREAEDVVDDEWEMWPLLLQEKWRYLRRSLWPGTQFWA